MPCFFSSEWPGKRNHSHTTSPSFAIEQYYKSSACHQQNTEKRREQTFILALQNSEDAVALSSPGILEYRLELKDWNRNYIFWMPTQGPKMATGHDTHPRRLFIFIFMFRSTLRISLFDTIDSDICKHYNTFLCCFISVLTGNENEKHLFCCWSPFNDSSRQLAKSSSGYRGEIKVNSSDQTFTNTWPELYFLTLWSQTYYDLKKLPLKSTGFLILQSLAQKFGALKQ